MNKYFLVIFMFFFGLLGCQPETTDLTDSELQQVDTLYSRQLETLRPLLDSLCTLREDSLIKIAVDSITKVRMEEINEILNR